MTIAPLPNGEFPCHWTCPGCGHEQDDSVHPEDGPWVSCVCGACGNAFDDHHLDEASRESWEQARQAAEAKGGVTLMRRSV